MPKEGNKQIIIISLKVDERREQKGEMTKGGNKQIIIISFKGWWEKRAKRGDAQGG